MSAGFLEAFLNRAAAAPAADAFVLHTGDDPVTLTNGMLRAGALRWASLLRARGARPGDVILISLPLGPDLVQGFLGALCAGCVPSFMPCPSSKQDSTLFWSSHNRLFARLGGGLIVTTAGNGTAVTSHVRDATMTVLTPGDLDGVSTREDEPVHPWRRAETACLQHSSGTTGLKKGVALSFEAIEAQLGAYVDALGIEDHDTIVSWLPLYHDMGFVACLLLPLARGTRCVLLDPFRWLVDPLSLFEAIEHHRGTFAWMPNFAFAHLVTAAGDGTDPGERRRGGGGEGERRADLSSLRALIDCSEACRPDTLDAFQRRFAGWGLPPTCVRTCYAMAETVFAVTQSVGGRAPLVVRLGRGMLDLGRVATVAAEADDGVLLVSSGIPLAGVELAILDERHLTAAPDRVGEIAIKAPFLFTGYNGEPERTAAAFHEGFYLTGDLGFRRGDDLFVLGRVDDLMVLLGRNVYAHEVEALLGAVPGLKPGRILALGVDDRDIGSQHLIVLAERSDITLDPGDVRAGVRSRLEAVLGITPRKVAFVEAGWLVKSTSGKINRGENRRKYLAESGADDRGVVAVTNQG